ncbi:unnamed protein product, partial [Adineta ricciae]
MSTFLLAMIMAPSSDFSCRPYRTINSTSIRSRVCGRKDILPQLAYADEVAYDVVEFFNNYFGIDYPLTKIEHFAVPDFTGGAMENYGLLIYNEVGLFFDEKTVPASLKQSITTLIAHEVAHQWFGNLVSPSWWGDLWLKEGFASYMETLAADAVQPTWKQQEQFVVDKIFDFMEADSLPTSRPISIESTNPDDIFQLYDSITYSKGASVIRMMSMFLDAETFQRGIQAYLKKYSYSSATQENLWTSLSEAKNNTIKVAEIMNGWIRQAGYPVVEVNRINDVSGTRIVISQRPFNLLSSTITQQKWWIPFKYVQQSLNKELSESKLFWLNDTSQELNTSIASTSWILANPGYLGIYRTKYDAHNFRLIINQLHADHTRIPNINRGALIDDTFALSRAGLINATDAYELIQYLKRETDYVPWIAALSSMRQQEELLSNQNILTDVQTYFLELILPIYNRIGWMSIDSTTDWLQVLLQPDIVSAVCHYRHSACIEAARSAYRRWYLNPSLNEIPPDLRSTVYCTVVREGSKSVFNFFSTRLAQETVASETLNLLRGLACVENPSLVIWFLDQHLANDSIIRDQDILWSVANVARSARVNQIAWNWIRDNWSRLFQKWGKIESDLGDVIEAASSRFVTTRQRDEFQTFADSIPDKGTASRQFQLSTDRIRANLEWNIKNLGSIVAYFRSNNQSTVISYRLPSDIIPIHYDLFVKPYLNITNDNIRSSTFDGRVSIQLNVSHPTNQIILHKRFIEIKGAVEVTGSASVVSTSFNEDLDFFTIVLNRTLQINEQPTLRINYIGELRSDTNGFYLSSYVRSSDKTRRYLVASQMEPIAARRALPCFDEPMFKATFTVTVEHEQQYRVWSNMPIRNSSNQLNGWTLTQFEKTVPMCSYLLALVVADFECITQNNTGLYRNITTNVCAQAEKKESLSYALEIAAKSIHDFEEQYQISYPISKCDHIAIPDFDAGAMENFGCILYRETRLFYNNRTSSSSNKQNVAAVIAHELAHQWFGNLVSPAWWNDLWLNEGFAKWMEFVGTNKIHPEWDLFQQFIIQRWLAVMQDDSISFSHPVNMKLTRNEELTGIFDTITYSKGSSLLRMMSNFMSDATFNKGVTRYLRHHLYSTATQTNLWQALGEQMSEDNIQLPNNTTLDTIMNTWTNQLGYPYVDVTCDYTTGRVTVKQHQFLFDPKAQPPQSPYKYLWYIPLQFKSASASVSDLTWFHQERMNVTLNISVQANQWILANPNLLGFFRTNYDRQNWMLIREQLKSNHKSFTVIERAGLIDDAFNLARANILETSLVLDLINYVQNEDAYIVWERIVNGLSYIEQMIASKSSNIALYDQYQSYVIDLISPIYTKLGWQSQTSNQTEQWLDGLHRDLIISMACRQNVDDCIQHAQSLFNQWFDQPSNNSIGANFRSVVYCTAVRRGTRVQFQYLLNQYQQSNDPQEKARIQSALACTRDTELIRYLLEIHIDSQLNIIRPQDALSGIRAICRNLIAETECWSFVRSRWQQLFDQFGGSLSFVDLIKDITARFNTRQQLSEFEQFFEQTADTNNAQFQSSIERIRSNIQWIDKAKPNLVEWFNNRTNAIRLPLHWIPSHYELHFDLQLQTVYPNNAQPNTRFTGYASITVNCTQPTNEFRIHANKLQITSITLKRLNTPNNLIVDYTWLSASEILFCRLQERCLTNEIYQFEAEYTTELSQDMSGFYLSQYKTTNGTITHNIAATHMQPTLARTVFPCFDEPGFKAKFRISITHDSSFTVVRSNGAMLNGGQPVQQPNGRLLSEFEDTPPMSTYLVAFVVTDFECVS